MLALAVLVTKQRTTKQFCHRIRQLQLALAGAQLDASLQLSSPARRRVRELNRQQDK